MRSLPWFVCAGVLAVVASAACRWRKPGVPPTALPPAAKHGPGLQGHVCSQAIEGKAASAIGERTCSLLVGFLHDARPTLNVSTLATGVDPHTQAGVLAADWHIRTAGEARGTLAWLLEEGHRALYPQVCRILFSVPRTAREREIVLLNDRFDPVRLAHCIDNLERHAGPARESPARLAGRSCTWCAGLGHEPGDTCRAGRLRLWHANRGAGLGRDRAGCVAGLRADGVLAGGCGELPAGPGNVGRAWRRFAAAAGICPALPRRFP